MAKNQHQEAQMHAAGILQRPVAVYIKMFDPPWVLNCSLTANQNKNTITPNKIGIGDFTLKRLTC